MFYFIGHGILINDFVHKFDMSILGTSLHPWQLSSPRINIVMYFVHRFPLTLYIRGLLLSYEMEILRLGTDI